MSLLKDSLLVEGSAFAVVKVARLYLLSGMSFRFLHVVSYINSE